MKKYFIFFILIYLISTNTVLAAAVTATGLIPGQIWYSKDVIVEGDTIKIYTAVWNNTSSVLSAKVEFYDQNVVLGVRDVVVQPSQLKEADVSWKVTSGDHTITAKIISPNVTVSGKKESIVVDNTSTEASRRFVPVVIKTINGEAATSSDVIQSQIDKATSSIEDILPNSVSEPISKNMNIVSKWREDTLSKVLSAKETTKESLNLLSQDQKNANAKANLSKTSTGTVSSNKAPVEDATKKPIAYIRLFFLSVLSFLFGSKLVFYSAIVLIIFFIGRAIYRKIRRS